MVSDRAASACDETVFQAVSSPASGLPESPPQSGTSFPSKPKYITVPAQSKFEFLAGFKDEISDRAQPDDERPVGRKEDRCGEALAPFRNGSSHAEQTAIREQNISVVLLCLDAADFRYEHNPALFPIFQENTIRWKKRRG